LNSLSPAVPVADHADRPYSLGRSLHGPAQHVHVRKGHVEPIVCRNNARECGVTTDCVAASTSIVRGLTPRSFA
jgi:hypothetical protein